MYESFLLQNDEINTQQSLIGGTNIKKNRPRPKYYKLLGQIMNENVEVLPK